MWWIGARTASGRVDTLGEIGDDVRDDRDGSDHLGEVGRLHLVERVGVRVVIVEVRA